MQKGWSILFGAVLLASLGLFIVAPFVGWWLPPLANKESYGWDADMLFYLILGFTGFFFILTEAILVWCMWRFAGQPDRKAIYTHGNHRLELAWTIVPAAILLFIAFAQISAWEDIKYESRMKPPQQILEVSARQFEWRVRYPEKKVREELAVASEDDTEKWQVRIKKANEWGRNRLADYNDIHVVNEIHTWAGANTRVYLKTKDVLHSFFLPQMRLKQDAVPGKDFIPVWFKPDLDGWNTEFKDGKLIVTEGKEWELACAELCGWGHYKMQGKLYVHKDKNSYDAWLKHAQANERARERD